MTAMKEKLGEVVGSYDTACSRPDASTAEHRSFELPDGSIVQIPAAVRYAPAELLFDPAKASSKTLQDICASALNTVDPDFRAELLQHITVAGGT